MTKEAQRLTRAEVELATGSSRTTLARWMEQGTFPRPTYEGRTPFWTRGSVAAWIEESERARHARLAAVAAQARGIISARGGKR